MTGPRRTDRGHETGTPRVWLCGQDSPRRQRAGRYLSGTSQEPDTMLPEIARRAIITYTQVAEWAGHSVDVLLKVYAKCLDGQDAVARSWMANALK